MNKNVIRQPAAFGIENWLIAFFLLGCNGHQTVAVGYLAYNYTDKEIVSVAVNGEGGVLNVPAFGGGGGEVCCVVLPTRWTPSLQARIQWEEDGSWLKDADGNVVIRDGIKVLVRSPTKSRTVEVPKYGEGNEMGRFAIHFFPNDVVKIAVLPYGPGHTGYPYPYPKAPIQK